MTAGPLATAEGWLAGYRVFWPARLHDLKRFVESMPDEATAASRAPTTPRSRPKKKKRKP